MTTAGLRQPDERKVAVLIQLKRAVLMKQVTPRKGYLIVNLLKNPSDLGGDWSEDKAIYITPALTVGQISLVRPVTSGRLRVRSVHRVDREGRALLRVDFACPPDAKGGNPLDAIGIEGWMTVDPALGHAVCEHDVRLTYPGKSYFDHQSKGKVTYQNQADGAPLPKEVDVSLTEPFAKTYHFVAKGVLGAASPERVHPRRVRPRRLRFHPRARLQPRHGLGFRGRGARPGPRPFPQGPDPVSLK